jgi:hypothetical protein
MRNPCDWQFISIQVGLEFFDSSRNGLFTKNTSPMLEEPLGQLRNVFWTINEMADLNATHIQLRVES